MKYVGQAVRDYRHATGGNVIIAIGIATWDMMDEGTRSILIRTDDDVRYILLLNLIAFETGDNF